jgi:3-hydroxyacyl-[acyl-carrier-protein] dehydratase
MPETNAERGASIVDILRHIPHRYPFILIDRMEACEPGKWVRVVKNVSNSEWFFANDRGTERLVPSLLLVEALAQSSGALSYYSGLMADIRNPIIFFAGIDDCVFGRDVRPGEQVVLECTLVRALRGVIKVRARATVDDELVLELTLMAMVRESA